MIRYTIPNLRFTCDWVHSSCHVLVLGDPTATAAAWNARVKDEADGAGALLSRLREHVAGIDASLGHLAAAATDLTKPARQALGWMRYLTEGRHLADNLTTLGALHRDVARQRERNAGVSRLMATPAHVWIRLRPSASLYRVTARHETLEVEINQGFAGTTPGVVEALAGLCVRPREPKLVDTVKRYSLTPRFTAVQQALESHALQLADEPCGRHHDLEASFHRVKAEYFGGELARPFRLLWTDQPTRCRLGYYHTALDAVVISRTLDDRQVPPFVLDFVMYHELLHKALGVKLRGGRAQSHTAEFRAFEARFQRRREAEAVLDRLVRRMAARTR